MSGGGTAKSSERTLLTALLMSAPGPLLTGIAALGSGSATQIADFVRRTTELLASGTSYAVFRRLARSGADAAERARLEEIAGRVVAAAMVVSAAAMAVVGAYRLAFGGTAGRGILGLVIAGLGLVANGIFFVRYRHLARAGAGAVIEAQTRLYRAKVFVDACVVAALCAVLIAPGHPAVRYVDALGCLTVAGYLLISGMRMVRGTSAKRAGG